MYLTYPISLNDKFNVYIVYDTCIVFFFYLQDEFRSMIHHHQTTLRTYF